MGGIQEAKGEKAPKSKVPSKMSDVALMEKQNKRT